MIKQVEERFAQREEYIDSPEKVDHLAHHGGLSNKRHSFASDFYTPEERKSEDDFAEPIRIYKQFTPKKTTIQAENSPMKR